MGARIQGEGTHRILVQGVEALHNARRDLITDRIEAGTYAIAAAITGGHLEILGAHLEPVSYTHLTLPTICSV